MPRARRIIAGDWGTTVVRLTLCDEETVIGQVTGPGVGAASEPAASVFARLTAPWMAEHGPLPAILCGMVGSTLGWIDTPYLRCPADAAALRANCARIANVAASIIVVPGLACLNPLCAPDVMRGEETQIVGALLLAPGAAARGIVLPGTHTKWALLRDGRIEIFQTSLTGELFALLCTHSILVRAAGFGDAPCGDGFEEGVRRALACAGTSLTHLLFEVRSRQLIESLPHDWAVDYLSGLLIGSDVTSARAMYVHAGEMLVVGAPAIAALYARALAMCGVSTLTRDGEACVLAGLRAVYADPS